MRENIDLEQLENVTGGAIDFCWDAEKQSGTVSSNITGQTFTFGADKADAVYQYVIRHRLESDKSQMDAIEAIING